MSVACVMYTCIIMLLYEVNGLLTVLRCCRRLLTHPPTPRVLKAAVLGSSCRESRVVFQSVFRSQTRWLRKPLYLAAKQAKTSLAVKTAQMGKSLCKGSRQFLSPQAKQIAQQTAVLATPK